MALMYKIISVDLYLLFLLNVLISFAWSERHWSFSLIPFCLQTYQPILHVGVIKSSGGWVTVLVFILCLTVTFKQVRNEPV